VTRAKKNDAMSNENIFICIFFSRRVPLWACCYCWLRSGGDLVGEESPDQGPGPQRNYCLYSETATE
jgi:hypothetical protein